MLVESSRAAIRNLCHRGGPLLVAGGDEFRLFLRGNCVQRRIVADETHEVEASRWRRMIVEVSLNAW